MSTDLKTRLGTPADAGAFLGLAFDFALAQPVSTYVLADRILAHLDHALSEPRLVEWTERHLRPFLERERARAKERGDRVRDWMTAELQAELRALAAKPVELDPKMVERLVRQDSVRHMLRSVVQETLDRFVDTLRPGGQGGGLLGSVGRSAFGFASRASKGILGNISSQIESQLKSAVTGFVQSSMNMMLDRVVHIIRSPEMRRQLSRSGVALYDEVVKSKTTDIWEFVMARVDLDDLLEAIPGQLAHNLERPAIRDGLLAEVAAFLDVEGERPVSTLLAPESVASLRADVIDIGTPLLGALAQTPAFAAWEAGDTSAALPPEVAPDAVETGPEEDSAPEPEPEPEQEAEPEAEPEADPVAEKDEAEAEAKSAADDDAE